MKTETEEELAEDKKQLMDQQMAIKNFITHQNTHKDNNRKKNLAMLEENLNAQNSKKTWK